MTGYYFIAFLLLSKAYRPTSNFLALSSFFCNQS